jgi:hypothetical protein
VPPLVGRAVGVGLVFPVLAPPSGPWFFLHFSSIAIVTPDWDVERSEGFRRRGESERLHKAAEEDDPLINSCAMILVLLCRPCL